MNIDISVIGLKNNYGVIPLSLNFDYRDPEKKCNCFQGNHNGRAKSSPRNTMLENV
jgi:hypothetical protein